MDHYLWKEKNADLFANNYLISEDHYYDFVTNTIRFDGKTVKKFAEKIEIHPSIVVGRLQKENIIGYHKLNHLKTKYAINLPAA